MKIKYILAFVALYSVSLVLTAPASMITRFMPKNLGIEIADASGTLWDGKMSQINYRNQFQLQKVTWKLDWLALLTLQLKASVKFTKGRDMLSGKGIVAYGLSGLTLSDVKADMKASEVVQYLTLPVPITPQGDFSLVIENATQGSPYCNEIDGYLVWHKGKVETPMGNIDFATPSVDLSCDEGNVIATLKQNSEQLTTNAAVTLEQGGTYKIQGTVMGREKLDPSILQALSWIGPKNGKGETPINFTGRL